MWRPQRDSNPRSLP